ncbi:MAG: 7-cyano-7-deazaguanine synthase QueC [Phycisphaerales bacterium]
MTETSNAVVLLSGGLDSATTLAIARNAGHARIVALSFDYGQRHRFELRAAEQVAESVGVDRHVVLTIDLRSFGGSSLTSDDHAVPKHDRVEEIGGVDIPSTYVPARNTIFLAFALGLAEVEDANTIYIGVNALDYSGYPDCRPEFIEAFERLARLATKRGVEGTSFSIAAPLLHMTKRDIIRRGIELGVDYALTFSCYDPDREGRACGRCDSCLLRKRGFHDAGVADPTAYQSFSNELRS